MCWIIPLIVGIISAIIGYLLGRRITKENISTSQQQDTLSLKSHIENAPNNSDEPSIPTNIDTFSTEDIEKHPEYLSLSQQYQQEKTNHQQLKTDYDTLKQQYDSEGIEQNNRFLSELRAENQRLETTIKTLETQQSVDQQQLNETQQQLDVLKTEYSEQKIAITDLEKQLSNCKHQHTDNQSTIKQLQSDNDKLNQTLQALDNELAEHKNQAKSVSEKVNNKEKNMFDTDSIQAHQSIETEQHHDESTSHLISALPTKQDENKQNKTPETTSNKHNSNDINKPFDAAEARAILGKRIKDNDLTVVEGIGSKIAKVFKNNGIDTWLILSKTSVEECRELLDNAGKRFAIHKPDTWPEQAALAAKHEWKALHKLQSKLKGGKKK